jgi:hypothetical protein
MTALENMDSSFKIKLLDVKKITDRLFDHLIETRGEKEIDIDRSFYWHIPFDELFDMEKKPQNIDVGSLEDDWEFVSEILKEEHSAVARQFTELSILFRFIGEKMGEKLAAVGG